MNGTPQRKESFQARQRPSTYRRVVTANVNGKSILRSDEQLQAYEFRSVPSYEHTLVWVNPTTPDLREEQRFDRYPDSIVPGPGGTSLHFVTFPPVRFSRIRRFTVMLRAASSESAQRVSRSLRKRRSCNAPS